MITRIERRRVVVTLLLFSLLHSTMFAAELPRVDLAQVKTVDVKLDAQQRLQGAVVDGQGKPQPTTTVEFWRSGESQAVTAVRTDHDGKFHVVRLRPGTYRLVTSEGCVLVRVWAAQTAPPQAATSVVIVNDAQIERGQRPISELFTSDPLFITSIVAAAIAIPVAVHKARDKRSDGS